MRKPNYKVGWLLPERLAALTHFHSEIIQDDVVGVFQETHELLKNVDKPFHVIIDNHLVQNNHIYSLEELQSMSPILSHPQLENLVIVKPQHLTLSEKQKEVETIKNVQLKNVSSIREAIDFLLERNVLTHKEEIDLSFFP